MLSSIRDPNSCLLCLGMTWSAFVDWNSSRRLVCVDKACTQQDPSAVGMPLLPGGSHLIGVPASKSPLPLECRLPQPSSPFLNNEKVGGGGFCAELCNCSGSRVSLVRSKALRDSSPQKKCPGRESGADVDWRGFSPHSVVFPLY